MVHVYSQEALDRRRKRAYERGYTAVAPSGFRFLLVREDLKEVVLACYRSLQLHLEHDRLAGAVHHHGRHATLLAHGQGKIGNDELKSSLRTHRSAGRAKHTVSVSRCTPQDSLRLNDVVFDNDPWHGKHLGSAGSTPDYDWIDPWDAFFRRRNMNGFDATESRDGNFRDGGDGDRPLTSLCAAPSRVLEDFSSVTYDAGSEVKEGREDVPDFFQLDLAFARLHEAMAAIPDLPEVHLHAPGTFFEPMPLEAVAAIDIDCIKRTSAALMRFAHAYAYLYNISDDDEVLSTGAALNDTDIVDHNNLDPYSDGDLMNYKLFTAIWTGLGIDNFMPQTLLERTDTTPEALFLEPQACYARRWVI